MNNNDCFDSSYCCSHGKCIDGVTCSFGLKRGTDNCDYKYECTSRCCSDNKCNDAVSECLQTCKFNHDCLYSGCCSDGHCVNELIC